MQVIKGRPVSILLTWHIAWVSRACLLFRGCSRAGSSFLRRLRHAPEAQLSPTTASFGAARPSLPFRPYAVNYKSQQFLRYIVPLVKKVIFGIPGSGQGWRLQFLTLVGSPVQSSPWLVLIPTWKPSSQVALQSVQSKSSSWLHMVPLVSKS